MKRKYTLFFDETDKRDLLLLGGKGANLSEMTGAGFPVPFGFCVTTESYKEFIDHNNLSEFIAQAIKPASHENIDQIGEKIRARIKPLLRKSLL